MVHCPPLFRFALATMAVAATATQAQPAWKPERPVEVVVPAAAGGSIDATARLIQRTLQSARLVETPVLAVNKAGGGGRIAVHYMDQHAGDGHYLLTSTMGIMTNHILGRSTTTWSDYTPLATLFSEWRPAGRHSFAFTADAIPDGAYTIAVTATTPSARPVTARTQLYVSRELPLR